MMTYWICQRNISILNPIAQLLVTETFIDTFRASNHERVLTTRILDYT